MSRMRPKSVKPVRKKNTLLTFRCHQEFVDKINQFHQETNLSKTAIVEIAIFSFLSLTKTEQKKLISNFITKDF